MAEPAPQYDAIVIGAGVTGLTTAFYLQQAGLRTAVFDQRGRTGGVVETKSVNGFLLEYGPNSTLFGPGIRRLIGDLSLESEVIRPGSGAKKRFVAIQSRTGPKLVQTPNGLFDAIRSPILSPAGKLRVLAEPFIRTGRTEDESVRDFITRRFGPEIADRLVDPILGGIWAADISKLSCRTGLARVWDLERSAGSVLGGAIKRAIRSRLDSEKAKPAGSKRGDLISFRSGMAQISSALSAAPGMNVHLGCTVKSLNLAAGGVSVQIEASAQPEKLVNSPDSSPISAQNISARHVVLAVDSLPAAALLEPYDRQCAEAIRAVPYAPLGILHLACKKGAARNSLDGFGFLVPRSLGGTVLGAIFSSSLFPGRAPDGTELLTCFIGGATRPDRCNPHDAGIAGPAVAEIRQLLGISAEIEIIDRTFLPRAIPNYSLGHNQTQERLSRLEVDFPCLTISGNWRSGTGVVDRISAAASSADRICGLLGIRAAE